MYLCFIAYHLVSNNQSVCSSLGRTITHVLGIFFMTCSSLCRVEDPHVLFLGCCYTHLQAVRLGTGQAGLKVLQLFTVWNFSEMEMCMRQGSDVLSLLLLCHSAYTMFCNAQFIPNRRCTEKTSTIGFQYHPIQNPCYFIL